MTKLIVAFHNFSYAPKNEVRTSHTRYKRPIRYGVFRGINAVAQLVEALRYEPEGGGFDF
jgi:hypothetical protein